MWKRQIWTWSAIAVWILMDFAKWPQHGCWSEIILYSRMHVVRMSFEKIHSKALNGKCPIKFGIIQMILYIIRQKGWLSGLSAKRVETHTKDFLTILRNDRLLFSSLFSFSSMSLLSGLIMTVTLVQGADLNLDEPVNMDNIFFFINNGLMPDRKR